MPINEPVNISTADIVPEDIYLAEIADVEIVEGKKYQSTEMEKKLQFTFKVLEGAQAGKTFQKRTTFKYTGGTMSSGLFLIVQAVVGTVVPADKINMTFLNSLIGARLRVVVKNTVDAQGREWNNCDSFMKAPTVTAPATEAVAAAPTPTPAVEATPAPTAEAPANEYPAI